MVRLATDREFAEIQQIIRRLKEARSQPNVRLAFKDGRVYDGAITFVERLGTGRLINIDREFALGFNVYDIRAVEY